MHCCSHPEPLRKRSSRRITISCVHATQILLGPACQQMKRMTEAQMTSVHSLTLLSWRYKPPPALSSNSSSWLCMIDADKLAVHRALYTVTDCNNQACIRARVPAVNRQFSVPLQSPWCWRLTLLPPMQTLMDAEKRAAYDALMGFTSGAINPFNDRSHTPDKVRLGFPPSIHACP